MEPKGLTLRDYFAAQALIGWRQSENTETYKQDAEAAYKMADAMIKQRQIQPKGVI